MIPRRERPRREQGPPTGETIMTTTLPAAEAIEMPDFLHGERQTIGGGTVRDAMPYPYMVAYVRGQVDGQMQYGFAYCCTDWGGLLEEGDYDPTLTPNATLTGDPVYVDWMGGSVYDLTGDVKPGWTYDKTANEWTYEEEED
jgi:hypothetical protein